MSNERPSASLVARIAGNVAPSLVPLVPRYGGNFNHKQVAEEAVSLAMQILNETDRHMKEWAMANPKKYRTVYVVTGGGDFPLDMLRYDEAFPKHESEARGLTMTEEESTDIILKPRTVTLVKFHADPKPNIGEPRWQSFGWKLDHIVETVKL